MVGVGCGPLGPHPGEQQRLTSLLLIVVRASPATKKHSPLLSWLAFGD
jgi:hypothetical protein